MAHLVHNGNFNSDTARTAVNKRWAKERARRSTEQHRQAVADYFEAKGIEPEFKNPLEYFASVMNDANLDHSIRGAAAKELLPYICGKAPLDSPMAGTSDPGDDPVLAEKRQKAFDLINGLLEQNAKLLAQVNGQPSNQADPKSESETTHLEAEEVIPGDEYKPGRAPLDNTTIDGEIE
ncbi:hypothetical protein [Ruegeria sp. HKCCC2117]|uniref:hypothetical protein n=1 Tax=Ruegeria sp. HKCCC2117 TaxID=2682992 RepID=UPI0014879CEE|nr:hypothetical protein [Ruegeria sp. HKCCC2117]